MNAIFHMHMTILSKENRQIHRLSVFYCLVQIIFQQMVLSTKKSIR